MPPPIVRDSIYSWHNECAFAAKYWPRRAPVLFPVPLTCKEHSDSQCSRTFICIFTAPTSSGSRLKWTFPSTFTLQLDSDGLSKLMFRLFLEKEKKVCLCVEARGNQVRTNSHTDNYHQEAIVPKKKLELYRDPTESVSSFVSCVCRLASVCQEKPKEYKRKIMSVQGHTNKVKHTFEPVTRRRVLFHFFSNKKVEINKFLQLSLFICPEFYPLLSLYRYFKNVCWSGF